MGNSSSKSKFKPIPQIHGHSDLSLDGGATVSDIVDRFAELEIPYGTLTEHGNMNSAMELYQSCKKKGIKPILGIEAYVEDEWSEPEYFQSGKKKGEKKRKYVHLTIHFKDDIAYRYFCNLTRKMEENAIVTAFGERKPTMRLEDLYAIRDHITLGCGCLVGVVSKHLLKGNTDLAKKMYSIIREIPKEGSFFVEVFPHEVTHNWKGPKYDNKTNRLIEKGYFFKNECTAFAPDGDLQKSVNKFVIELAEQYGDPVVPSLDFHMAKPEQKVIQDLRLGQGREQWKFYNTYDIKSQDEVAEFFIKTHGISAKTFERWVDNAYMWASNFNNFHIPTSSERWVLPEFEGDSMVWIKKIIEKVGRMDWNNPEMVHRLKTEIQTLKFNGKLDVLPYFAPIVDLTNWCDEHGILYNLRGSASGSLLVYLLGISGVNPLQYGLSFERFINEGRIKANTLPDADIDIGERDKAIEYLKEKYGDKIMQLSVDVKSKIKVALKDAERFVKGSVSDETEAICRSIPNPPQGADEHGYVFGYEDEDGTHHPGVLESNEKLQEYAQNNPEIWNYATQALGIIRNKGSHACAVVITDKAVTNYVPTFSVGGELVTAFSPKWIESAGLVKYDILGVNTLNDVGRCLKLIKDKRGVTLDVHNLPDDPEVYGEFARGNTETVFQFNTATVIPFLIKLRPKTIEELANITALARPGTLDAPSGDGRTLADVYVSRARSEEPISYIHPDLEPILKNTYGVQLYQEIQIQIFKDLAGYTAEEAEAVRRGIGKKDEKILNEAISRLKTSCVSRGWEVGQVTLLADQIFAASRYSFNKSHAVSYAKLGYACQYLKTKYPIEWWCAVLSNSSKTEISTFWPYCGSFVLLPDINKSGDGWEIQGDNIRAPISILNGIGESAYAQIMSLKPYTDIKDFVFRHKQNNSRAVHKGVICKLIASGIMDSLFPVDAALNDKLFAYMSLKAEAEGVSKIEDIPDEYLPKNSLEKFCMVKELIPVVSLDLRPYILPSMGVPAPSNPLGVWRHTSKHPYKKGEEVVRSYINGSMMPKILDIFRRDPRMADGLGTIITVSYVIEEKTKSYSGKEKQMTQLLIDTGGTFQEVVVWPKYGESIAATGFKGKICKFGWKYNAKRGELMVSFTEVVDISDFKV
jgi:DNA polymerase-3 subunit alpha